MSEKQRKCCTNANASEASVVSFVIKGCRKQTGNVKEVLKSMLALATLFNESYETEKG